MACVLHRQRNHIRGGSGLEAFAGHGHGKPVGEHFEENTLCVLVPVWQSG